MKPLLKFEKPAILSRIFYGIFAMLILGFASLFIVLPVTHLIRDSSSGNVPWSLVAFLIIGLPFAGLMIWLAARYRVWILPYQFTVDYSEQVCGYNWRESWMDRVSLADLRALVSVPAYSDTVWPWLIYADYRDDRDRKVIFNSHEQFGSEADSFKDCLRTCRILSDYLEVPIEFDEWTKEVVAENQMGEQDAAPQIRPRWRVGG